MNLFPAAILFAALAAAAHAEAPFVRIGRLDPQLHDKAVVRTQGVVIDALPDEVDPRYDILLLKNAESILPVTLPHTPDGHAALLDAQVAVRGTFNKVTDGNRNLSAPYLNAHAESNVAVVAAAIAPFDVPELEIHSYASAIDVLRLGRRRVSGTVLATWRGDHFLMCTDTNRMMTVRLVKSGELPEPGDRVTASGYPETDLFHVNLAKARCRPASTPAPDDVARRLAEPAVPVARAFSRRQGTVYFDSNFQGRRVTLRGVVRSLPSVGNAEGRLNVESSGVLVPVDTSAHPEAEGGLTLGCEVEITGVCLLECADWSQRAVFPHISGFSVIVRGKDDVRVLSRPPWWTPGRIWAVVGVLGMAMLAVLVWNASLRARAERRGRQLLREQLESVKANLKIDERTRMAVELHDSLSQSLTGVSMEIAAADRAAGDLPPAMRTHLDRAERTLKSCRDELKNCIWDLRSQALEEPDMTQAILKTLQPHVSDASRILVRFNVPRARLSDNAAHAVLRAVRELVVNALRHGDARTVKVAGTLDAEALRFSVGDDGRGFDPDDRPGVLQGHFGLQGLAERAKQFGGAVSIDSAPGRGAVVTVTLPAAATTPSPVGVS
ncbi:MAG: sensor histidine kinase [Kiritimatiellae bacterium]|nr:sensor histidine kinase [Kiritimatiellia bacterium]